jgi:phosphatidylserine/phosphatidylglycerophosphate/cardiolipin synthase-like enzyme
MQTPNLNDNDAKAALLEAVRRGVRVDVILSKGFNDATEVAPGQGGTNDTNAAALYDALADLPDACDRLRIRWYSRDGQAPVVGNGIYASHAKYTSVDSAIAVVGTANMDTQSWNNSREVNVLVDDPDLTTAWDDQLFVADFERAIPVDACRR